MTIHDRLREARSRLYETAEDAANALGMKYPTYVAHENGSRGITRRSAERYAKFFGIPLDYFLTGRHNVAGEASVVSFTGEAMPVRGFVRASSWQESYAPESVKSLPISADARYPGRRQFALQIQGDSINRRAQDGEYAICVEFDGEKVKDGDVVVVERRRAGLFEATIKVVRINARGEPELWPDSTNPDHSKPIALIDGNAGDDDEVVIVAHVVGYYRLG